MIPMVDLKTQYAQLKDEIDAGMKEVLDTCAFVLGPNVQAFEKEAAAYLGVKHAIGCASGTDALHLALRAAGITEGDEVITSAFTFIATAEAIAYVAPSRCSWTSIPALSTSPPKPSKPLSRRVPRPSCRCICSASPATWGRSWRYAPSTA